MSKTRKHIHKNNIKKKKYTHRKTIKKNKDIIIPSETSVSVRKISKKIANNLARGSYAPTINKELITLKSIPREELYGCNLAEAYQLKEPLKINISHQYGEKKCVYYYTSEAEKILLKNLQANKHIQPHKIVPPIQSQSNCWFNAMFVTFFISDKGRKFFHFLRQLMIKGRQKDKTPMPQNLRNVFALLNFGIESCILGNEFAYELNTNVIIHEIYKQIPDNFKAQYKSIIDVDHAGNPLLYYIGIINYLNNDSIQLLFVRESKSDWKDKVKESVDKMNHLPHIIVLEIFDEDAKKFDKKPFSFTVNNAKYQIDSAVVRDISKQHFCATISCEGQEMGYDGMSFHRIVPLMWKHKMNTDFTWQFEGTNDYDGTPLKWNFTKCYQLLIYYRVE